MRGFRNGDAGWGAPDGVRLWVVLLLGAVAMLVAGANVWVLLKSRDGDRDVAGSAAAVAVTTMGVPPVDASRLGAYTESRVGRDGDVQVEQWIRSSAPLTSLRLAAPDLSPPIRLPMTVRVTYDRSPRVGWSGSCFDCSSRVTTVGRYGDRVQLDGRAYVVQLRYTLRGAGDTTSTVQGRVLVRAAALDVEYYPRVLPARVVLTGSRVLSAACSASSASDGGSNVPTPCGAPTARGWQVDQTGGHRGDSVMAVVQFGR